MRIVGALLVVGGLASGCQDATELGPERVPPPDSQRIQEGTLDDPTEPCGTLDVEEPRRLSATPGDSDGVRMALLPRPGAEAWVGVAWLEHRGADPEAGAARVSFQTLLEDGVPFGEAQTLDADIPESVDLVPWPGAEGFLLVAGDRALGSTLTGVSPLPIPEPGVHVALVDIDHPRVVAGTERGLIVGLDAGDPGPREIHLIDVSVGEGVTPTFEFQTLPRLTATDLAIASSGPETWLAWNDGDVIWGAPLSQDEEGTWEVPEGQGGVLDGFTGPLRRAHGTIDLAVAYTMAGQQLVTRFEANGWRTIGSGSGDPSVTDSLAATRGESGGRWAIARTFDPGDGTPPEVRIERVRANQQFCAAVGECVRVTTDLRASSAPEILAVEGGYLVAWSDVVEGGQTDVFVTRAACHATTERPSD